MSVLCSMANWISSCFFLFTRLFAFQAAIFIVFSRLIMFDKFHLLHHGIELCHYNCYAVSGGVFGGGTVCFGSFWKSPVTGYVRIPAVCASGCILFFN